MGNDASALFSRRVGARYLLGMTIKARTVDEYVELVPDERKEAFGKLRSVIVANLPEGFVEAMSYNMPSYVVPHSRYPAGYHCKPEEPLPFLSIGSQKHFIGFYHMGVYTRPDLLDWFKDEYAERNIGKLDMGKSCVRLKNMDRIPYDLLGELTTKMSVEEWIETYERAIKK